MTAPLTRQLRYFSVAKCTKIISNIYLWMIVKNVLVNLISENNFKILYPPPQKVLVRHRGCYFSKYKATQEQSHICRSETFLATVE